MRQTSQTDPIIAQDMKINKPTFSVNLKNSGNNPEPVLAQMDQLDKQFANNLQKYLELIRKSEKSQEENTLLENLKIELKEMLGNDFDKEIKATEPKTINFTVFKFGLLNKPISLSLPVPIVLAKTIIEWFGNKPKKKKKGNDSNAENTLKGEKTFMDKIIGRFFKAIYIYFLRHRNIALMILGLGCVSLGIYFGGMRELNTTSIALLAIGSTLLFLAILARYFQSRINKKVNNSFVNQLGKNKEYQKNKHKFRCVLTSLRKDENNENQNTQTHKLVSINITKKDQLPKLDEGTIKNLQLAMQQNKKWGTLSSIKKTNDEINTARESIKSLTGMDIKERLDDAKSRHFALQGFIFLSVLVLLAYTGVVQGGLLPIEVPAFTVTIAYALSFVLLYILLRNTKSYKHAKLFQEFKLACQLAEFYNKQEPKNVSGNNFEVNVNFAQNGDIKVEPALTTQTANDLRKLEIAIKSDKLTLKDKEILVENAWEENNQDRKANIAKIVNDSNNQDLKDLNIIKEYQSLVSLNTPNNLAGLSPEEMKTAAKDQNDAAIVKLEEEIKATEKEIDNLNKTGVLRKKDPTKLQEKVAKLKARLELHQDAKDNPLASISELNQGIVMTGDVKRYSLEKILKNTDQATLKSIHNKIVEENEELKQKIITNLQRSTDKTDAEKERLISNVNQRFDKANTNNMLKSTIVNLNIPNLKEVARKQLLEREIPAEQILDLYDILQEHLKEQYTQDHIQGKIDKHQLKGAKTYTLASLMSKAGINLWGENLAKKIKKLKEQLNKTPNNENLENNSYKGNKFIQALKNLKAKNNPSKKDLEKQQFSVQEVLAAKEIYSKLQGYFPRKIEDLEKKQKKAANKAKKPKP